MRLHEYLTAAAAPAGARLFVASFGLAVLFVMGMACIPIGAAPSVAATPPTQLPLSRSRACVPWGHIDLAALDAWRFGPSHPTSPGLFSLPAPPCQ